MTRVPIRGASPADSSSRRIGGVLVGIAVLAAALAFGVTVTKVGAARTGELGLDESIAQHRDAVLTWVALAINVGFGTLVAPLLLLVTCATLWFRNRFAAVAFGCLTVIGWLSVEVGKVLVHRTRPPAAAVHALVSETAPDSYPSGHTAFAAAALFAVVAVLVLTGRPTRVVWIVGAPVVAIVALSRLYLGVHYLTDVLASVVFAAASVLVAATLCHPWLVPLRDRDRHRRHRHTVPRDAEFPQS
ncbi:hypothetical protein GCM10009721_39630 [Terrabacter tumescens]|uniref:Phosphatidic acid phosphatase type 2/haloperoxidase domain-containing protein n=1 Tax=Terrabacter tumescens TaxID=60443 RepID=A0ABQ2IH59_9MICO|nr:phosphatase PAP2 family protein [Terrabacter tumescens]GGN08014.1 hypothetical protein GCM10009721_39630 [Terrabacter tumescens]